MENKVFKIFVYGSLRSGFKNPAYEYISKYFKLVSEASVKGKLYDMGNYPAAIPTSEEAYITGELYELKNENEFTWAMEQLDDYEGVNPDDGQPPLYIRNVTDVLVNSSTVAAWIYWYNGSVEDQPLIASGDVLQFIQQKSKL
jgi:gamma-glutamylcyclotransferase (GGCT)/AIG2-like uncharacterized protein YtfP